MGSNGFDFRWGIPEYDDLIDGYAHIPGFIMRNYAKTGVQGREFELIAQLSSFKYNCENGQSSPGILTVADRMGFSGADKTKHKSVSRIIKSLENKGLLIVIRRKGDTSIYNFRPLSEKCLELEKLSKQDNTPSPKLGGLPPPKSGGKEQEDKNKKTPPKSPTPISKVATPKKVPPTGGEPSVYQFVAKTWCNVDSIDRMSQNDRWNMDCMMDEIEIVIPKPTVKDIQSFIDWYWKKFPTREMLPGEKKIAATLRLWRSEVVTKEVATVLSESFDPVTGTTTYEVRKADGTTAVITR